MSELAQPMSENEHLHEQFADIDQQRDTATTGMWLFLATEVMFFGGLFAAYTVYRFQMYEMFREMSRHLDVGMGTLNTAVLLTSSLTMAMAVHSAKEAEPGKVKAIAGYLGATFLFGLAFLGIKAKEWTDDYYHGLFPGHWLYTGKYSQTGHVYFDLYYAMVGLHGLHVAIGCLLLLVFLIRAWRGHYSQCRFTPVVVLGLYWHYVDLVWIFLYPLFYLIDPK